MLIKPTSNTLMTRHIVPEPVIVDTARPLRLWCLGRELTLKLVLRNRRSRPVTRFLKPIFEVLTIVLVHDLHTHCRLFIYVYRLTGIT